MAADSPHWVELRIHGVSGTPPEAMLDSAHTKQVAGDAWGRFFRPVDSLGQEIRSPGRILEGYHWGRFTSGSWRQGLWLILIPFGVVNAAAFMLPHPGERRAIRIWHAVVSGLIRGIGAGLTCTFALSASLILIDLFAWQTASNFAWLDTVPTGWLMAGGVILAGLVMFALYSLGNQNRLRQAPEDAPGSIAESTTIGLCRRAFYSGDPDAPTLGRLHLSVGWSVVAVIGSLTAQRVSTSTFADGVFVLALVFAIVIIAAITFLGDPSASVTGTQTHEVWHKTVMEPVSKLAEVVSLALVVCAAFALRGTDRSAATLDFDRYSRWLAAVIALAVLGLLIANAVLSWLTRDMDDGVPRSFGRYAKGMAPWAATATGLFVGIGFSGAFVLGTAKAIDAKAQTALIYRVAYDWGLTVLLLGGMALAALIFAVAKRTAAIREIEDSYAVVEPDAVLPTGWIHRIAFASGQSRVKNTIPLLFLTTATAGLLMTIVTTVEMFRGDLHASVGWLSGDVDDRGPAPFLIGLGTYVLIGLAAGMLVLGRRALRTEQTRRGVNVIWDVVSFWPHSAHPFVPAAYSQFAIRELRNRIRFHLGRLNEKPADGVADSVVVAAHSQGSLIAFASMLWLTKGEPDAEIEKVGLLTFGSQLQVAFPRAFPAYVNYTMIERMHDQLDDRWVNLYRETDPIAGPVLSWSRTPMSKGEPRSYSVGFVGERADRIDPLTGRRESGDDWRLLDPAPYDRDLQLGAVVKMGRHSGFTESPDYADAIARVRQGPFG